MALVVFLRGVNVGGHRTFRPSVLARRLKHLDVVNIGAAGTFVVRKPIGRSRLRREFARGLGFDAEIMICEGRDVVRLASRDVFPSRPARRDIVRFVSVLSRRPRAKPSIPADLPPTGPWLVRVLARHDRFVVGVYRRRMKAIGQLGALDRLFGARATTRSWTTLVAVAGVLAGEAVS